MRTYIGPGGYHPVLGQIEQGAQVDETRLTPEQLAEFGPLLVEPATSLQKPQPRES